MGVRGRPDRRAHDQVEFGAGLLQGEDRRGGPPPHPPRSPWHLLQPATAPFGNTTGPLPISPSPTFSPSAYFLSWSDCRAQRSLSDLGWVVLPVGWPTRRSGTNGRSSVSTPPYAGRPRKSSKFSSSTMARIRPTRYTMTACSKASTAAEDLRRASRPPRAMRSSTTSETATPATSWSRALSIDTTPSPMARCASSPVCSTRLIASNSRWLLATGLLTNPPSPILSFRAGQPRKQAEPASGMWPPYPHRPGQTPMAQVSTQLRQPGVAPLASLPAGPRRAGFRHPAPGPSTFCSRTEAPDHPGTVLEPLSSSDCGAVSTKISTARRLSSAPSSDCLRTGRSALSQCGK